MSETIMYIITLEMSNYDHTIDKGLAKALRAKPGEAHAEYCGRNFHSVVHYKDDKFHCEISQYHVVQETISEDTLPLIMTAVSDKYGYD